MATNPLKRIEHVVVLMLENRSFDNLLGWLYDPGNPAPFPKAPPANFAGVSGKSLSNPRLNGASVPVGKGKNVTAPFPDPGEPFEDVYAQIYGQKTTVPANEVPQPTMPPNMLGFVYNYTLKNAGNLANADTIMNCFTPDLVPVISSLALNYGLCDHWFASIPSQTLCNRSFVAAGTSSGYVNNDGGDGLLFINDTPTIFNLLSTTGKTWKVYCGGWTITSLVHLTQRQVWDFAVRPGYFAHVSDFLADAATAGGLPGYSFIEPNYMDSLVHGPENDMHPESHPFQLFGRSNVEQGENLVYQIYNAVRKSPDWDKILLVILFDEHGGCYDHAGPPDTSHCSFAISPDSVVIPPNKPGGTGFRFDRLGVRVPAIIVSAYTPPGSILNQSFDHTSILSTVVNTFDLPEGKLGQRQVEAPDVGEALPLSAPRQDLPNIPVPAAAEIGVAKRVAAVGEAILHAKSKPLSELQKKIMIGAAKRLGMPEDQQQNLAATSNVFDADAELVKFEAELALRRAVKRI
jgi:phospholipase C